MSGVDSLLTKALLKKIVPVSSMTIWRWVKAGTFPAPITHTGRPYWRMSEVQAWIEQRSAERKPAEGDQAATGL